MSDAPSTILVVDDDRTCLRLTESMLNRSGFQAHTINDSRIAIREIRRLKPRILLLDITMPHIDGYEVARQVRCDPELADTVIIAVTTMQGSDHERTAAAAGIDLQVTKPVDQRELTAAILVGDAHR